MTLPREQRVYIYILPTALFAYRLLYSSLRITTSKNNFVHFPFSNTPILY